VINILIFIATISLFSWPIAIFLNDAWLRDAQQRQLRQKFEAWWITVADLDKLKLALACTVKLNNALDVVFGARLFSSRAIWRSSIGATGLLIASLALIGLFNHKSFGVQLWNNCRETAEAVKAFVASFQSPPVKTITFPSPPLSTTNATLPTTNIFYPSTNTQTLTTNLHNLATNNPVSNSTNELMISITKFGKTVEKYNTTKLAVIYSILFLLILLVLNNVLCFFALVFSRLILREIIAACRPFSIIALLITNFVLVLIISTVVLLLLTILATPLVWFFLPILFGISEQSFSFLVLLLSGGGIAAWIFSSAALKLVTLIAMLPCLFALGVTAFSLAAIIGRNAFHKFISAVLLRCAEKGPLTMIVAIFTLTASCIAILGKLIHWAY
jgi:hypothetical protein